MRQRLDRRSPPPGLPPQPDRSGSHPLSAPKAAAEAAPPPVPSRRFGRILLGVLSALSSLLGLGRGMRTQALANEPQIVHVTTKPQSADPARDADPFGVADAVMTVRTEIRCTGFTAAEREVCAAAARNAAGVAEPAVAEEEEEDGSGVLTQVFVLAGGTLTAATAVLVALIGARSNERIKQMELAAGKDKPSAPPPPPAQPIVNVNIAMSGGTHAFNATGEAEIAGLADKVRDDVLAGLRASALRKDNAEA